MQNQDSDNISKPLVDTQNSPHAVLRTIPHTATVFDPASFWGRRMTVNRKHTLHIQYEQLIEAGNIHNLKLAAGLTEGKYKGPRYMDSDLYKWMEAAAMSLDSHSVASATPLARQGQPRTVRDEKIEMWLEETIEIIAKAQMPDGYLNSHFQVERPDELWADIHFEHQLYCAGHLIQAAIAHNRTTGKNNFLDIALKLAEHIANKFGPAPGKDACATGHPELELALVELARLTGDRKHIEQAKFFIDQRGTETSQLKGQVYLQDHVTVRETKHVAGHAVRQLYLLAGVVDLYMETGEDSLIEMCKHVWTDMVQNKLHIHGGVGSRHDGEAFGDPYELPNDRTYSETCAQISSIMWSWRTLLVTGESKYADLIERTLYNGFLSGINLEGDKFFYPNTLLSRGGVERKPWFGCACCPPNIARTFTSLGHLFATTNDNGIQLHLFDSVEIKTQYAHLIIQTEYPWDKRIAITFNEVINTEWTLQIRLPTWCQNSTFTLNSSSIEPSAIDNGYACFRREWNIDDELIVNHSMPARLTLANPQVEATRGCVAIERGPLVYCIEQAGVNEDVDILNACFDPLVKLETIARYELLEGARTIEFLALLPDREEWNDKLYQPFSAVKEVSNRVRVQAIPYYAWANRGAVPMKVWLPLVK